MTVLSPDGKYVYYMPDTQRKVIAFLKEALEECCHSVLGGTDGSKIDGSGGMLYVNLNGHAGDRSRPSQMKSTGFGLQAFAAIIIPLSER